MSCASGPAPKNGPRSPPSSARTQLSSEQRSFACSFDLNNARFTRTGHDRSRSNPNPGSPNHGPHTSCIPQMTSWYSVDSDLV